MNLPLVFLSLRALLLRWPSVPGWWELEPGSVLQMCLQGWCSSVLHSFLPASALQPGQHPPAFQECPSTSPVCISRAGDQISKQSFWVTSGWFGEEIFDLQKWCAVMVKPVCLFPNTFFSPSILFLSSLCWLIRHKFWLKKLLFVLY